MAVARTPDGRWYVTFWEDGRQRRTYCGRGDQGRRLAVSEDHRIKSLKALAHRQAGPRELTYRQVAERYLEAKGSPRWLKSALARLYPVLGSRPAARLTKRELAAALAPLECSAATKNRMAAYARAALGQAVEDGGLRVNPLAGFRMAREEPFKVNLPTLEELFRVLAAASKQEHLRRAILLTFYLVCRPGPSEVFGLKWSDVDFERNMVTVLQGKTKRLKLVPIAPPLRAELETWARDGEHIVSYRSGPVRDVGRAWATALRQAGITRPLRLYDLRHLAVTMMLDAQAGLKAVSTLAGHSSTKITVDRYYAYIDGSAAKAVNLLPDLTCVSRT